MNNKKDFQKRLDDIKLTNGWISRVPIIHPDIINITQKLLNELSNEDLENWSIEPFPNGTIMLSYEHENDHIVINITQSGMAYTFHKSSSVGEVGQHLFNTKDIHTDDGYSKMKYLIQNAKTLHY